MYRKREMESMEVDTSVGTQYSERKAKTSFAWKKKASPALKTLTNFLQGDDGEPSYLSGPVPPANKYRTRNNLSDEEYEVAIQRVQETCEREVWGAALKLIDDVLAKRCDERVLEMKAQILIELRRDYEAVRCCEAALHIDRLWWVAHQTLGRALLSFGEPKLALKSFQRAIWLNPAIGELHQELRWTWDNTEGSEAAEGSDFRLLVRKR